MWQVGDAAVPGLPGVLVMPGIQGSVIIRNELKAPPAQTVHTVLDASCEHILGNLNLMWFAEWMRPISVWYLMIW